MKQEERDLRQQLEETLQALQSYAWPGNIRELEHVIERAVITTQGSVLHLAEKIDSGNIPDRNSDPLSISSVEQEHIMTRRSTSRAIFWRCS